MAGLSVSAVVNYIRNGPLSSKALPKHFLFCLHQQSVPSGPSSSSPTLGVFFHVCHSKEWSCLIVVFICVSLVTGELASSSYVFFGEMSF